MKIKLFNRKRIETGFNEYMDLPKFRNETNEEFENRVNSFIEDIFDRKNEEYFKKAHSLVKELNDLKEESLSDINEANAVLEILYYDVLKNAKTWTLGTDTDITKHKDVFGLYFNTISSTNFIQAVLKQGDNNND